MTYEDRIMFLDNPFNVYIDPTLQKVVSDLVCNVNCTPHLTRVVTDDLICFDDAYSQTRYDDDTVLRDLVAAFYRRHRRACITVSKFMGRPVAHDLFLSSLPF